MDPAYLFALNRMVVIQVLVLLLVMVFLFLFFGALAAGVENITWTQVFLASFVGISAQWVVATTLSIIPLVGGILGFIFSIIAMVYVLRITFVVPWMQAAKIFVLASVAEIATGIVLELYTDIDLLSFAQKMFFVS